jgi:predicted aspartyl protease
VYYADGTGAVVPVAKADVSIHGIETATMILCGRPKSLVLLGATTLETLGFGVDPIHQTLMPIDAPMAAAWPAESAAAMIGSSVGGRRAEDAVHR